MSVRIRYEGKGGKPETMVVGSPEVAAKLMKGLKNAVVEPCEVAAPPVDVTTCPPAGAVEQHLASLAYYNEHWNPHKGSTGVETAEQRAEREHEYVTQGRLYGGNVNDLLSDLNG